MTAEILDPPTRFEIRPELREDGTIGPPRRLSITVRPCWQKPPRKLELFYLYEAEGVVYYGVQRG